MARINLKKFLTEHYRGGVNARDVIREAVTNSIHAGANKVRVDLSFAREPLAFNGDDRSSLARITVTDDGEGFTQENLNHFDEICTAHKDDIGGKGVGRLAFLKYANSVDVSSQLDDELVQFNYTAEFTLQDVRRYPTRGPKQTILNISKPKLLVNTQVAKLVNSLCDDFRLLLFLKKNSGRIISIEFTHNSEQPFRARYVLSGENIVAKKEHSFVFHDEVFKCYLFRDSAPQKGIVALLCADELCVEELYLSKRFDACRYLVSITSDYLNRHSNMARQRFEIPKAEDEEGMPILPINRDNLMQRIRDECLMMIKIAAQDDVTEFKRKNIRKLKKYYPFVEVSSVSGDVAMLDAEEIVKTYRAQIARREDQVVELMEQGKQVPFDDISHLASDDLARFIVHRALVIDSLSRMPVQAAESTLHDVILKKRSDGSSIRDNNLWLIDDKFLSYKSVYSERSLASIIRQVNENTESKEGRRPDIAAFYSTDRDDNPNKLVIIEFKKPSADIYENNKALVQCRRYASELTDQIGTVREVFAFSVVEIDDEFYNDLKSQTFMDVFSLSERVLYHDYLVGKNNNIPLHLYVMPVSSLITDARARNRVFEEVLRFNVERDAKTSGETEDSTAAMNAETFSEND